MKVWVVIDEGCQECGVESIPVGIYTSAWEAKDASETHARATHKGRHMGWRDGGQSRLCVYEMDTP